MEMLIEILAHHRSSGSPFQIYCYIEIAGTHLIIQANHCIQGGRVQFPGDLECGSWLHGYALSTAEQALNAGFGISRGLFQPFPDFSSKTTLRFHLCLPVARWRPLVPPTNTSQWA